MVRRARSRIAVRVHRARERAACTIDGRAAVQVRTRSQGTGEPRRTGVAVARVRAPRRSAAVRIHVRASRRTHLTGRAREVDAAGGGRAVASLVVAALARWARCGRAAWHADRAGPVASAGSVLRRNADEARPAVGVRRALLRRRETRSATAGDIRVRATREHRAIARRTAPRDSGRNRCRTRAFRKPTDDSSGP